MNNTEIAKKYGIKEILPYFFTEDCLKFYSKNDREIIQKDTIGLLSLEFSEYEYDEDNRFYIKMGGTIKYEYDGKEYDLFEYEDCFTFYTYLCNKKSKKFRNINLNDYKEFCKDSVLIYKDKYYCQYYMKYRSLFFFNRNECIMNPGPSVIKDLKIAKSQDLVSKYFDIKGEYAILKENIKEFQDVEDEAILVDFKKYYRNIIIEIFKMEKPDVYKNSIEKESEEVNSLKGIEDSHKRALKLYYLYANKEFTDFCNKICSPEIFDKELLKNGEVRKNLKNNFWIFHEFNGTLRDPNDDYIEGEDFTFLIINVIKSLEYLLYRKMCNDKDFKKIKYDDKITEKTMLDSLIYYVQNNSDMFKIIDNDLISKDTANSLIKSYIDLLYNVKDKCRNGYFHKHRIDDYDTLCEKREMVLEAIARTIIFLK